MMKKKIIAFIPLLLFILIQIDVTTNHKASAAMKNGEMVLLTKAEQVLETITFNGKTVEALYSNKAHANSDLTYSCAAFVKKFYTEIYGISVYNLSTTKSIPLIYNSQESFSETSTPQVGDIVRDNARTHWAIVKSIKGNTITVIQQNYKSGTSAWINCSIELSDTRYTYFTYSNRIKEDNSNHVATSNETTKHSEGSDDKPELGQDQISSQDVITEEIVSDLLQENKSEPVTNDEQKAQEASTPSVTIRNKTLYTGYKSYKLKFHRVQQEDQLSFKSSDTSVVKVSKNGTLTPVSKGTAFVTVVIKQGNNSYQQGVVVKVKDPYLKITNTKLQATAGETILLTAKAYGVDGPVVWSVSDQNVAEINKNTGLLTAKKKGAVVVTAECNNIKTKIKINLQ